MTEAYSVIIKDKSSTSFPIFDFITRIFSQLIVITVVLRAFSCHESIVTACGSWGLQFSIVDHIMESSLLS